MGHRATKITQRTCKKFHASVNIQGNMYELLKKGEINSTTFLDAVLPSVSGLVQPYVFYIRKH